MWRPADDGVHVHGGVDDSGSVDRKAFYPLGIHWILANFVAENYTHPMQVSIFKSLTAAKPKWTSLEKIVEMIMTNPYLEQYTRAARKRYASGKKGKADTIKKTCLPAFAPCGYFADGKGREDLIGLTGLCFIDIDKISEEQVEAALDTLKNDEHVLFAARSISGHGLHILVPYHLWREDPLSPIFVTGHKANNMYGKIFRPTAARYQELLQLPIDPSAENAERLCLISYDDKAYYNPSAAPIVYRYDPNNDGKKVKQYPLYEE